MTCLHMITCLRARLWGRIETKLTLQRTARSPNMGESAHAASLIVFKETALERAMSGLLRVFAQDDKYYASPI